MRELVTAAASSRRSSARRARWGSSSRRASAALARSRRTSGGAGTPNDEPVPRARSGALARARPQPGRVASADLDRAAGRAGGAAGAAQPDQLRLPPDAGVPQARRDVGRAPRGRALRRGRSPTSRPSSASTSRCRSTPAASACWPATTSRAPPTWACRWSASASSTTRATSASGSTSTAGSTRITSTSITACCRLEPATAATAAGRSSHRHAHRHDRARGSGRSRSAGTRCCCSTRTSTATQPEDRELTARLYGGDERVRIRQELLLGVGGVRALDGAGHPPGVVHLNEGHSAFAALEMIRHRMEQRGHRRGRGDAPRVARRPSSRRTRRSRPGHDRFSAALVEEHLGPLARGARASTTTTSWALGRVNPHDHARAVLHDRAGVEARRAGQRRVVAARPGLAAMWTAALSEPRRGGGADRPHHQRRPRADWLAPQMHQLYDRHLGPDWPQRGGRPGRLGSASTTSTTASCGRRTRCSRSRLIDFVRAARPRSRPSAAENAGAVVAQLRRALSLDALTIGFARRFATYKRANLIFAGHRADGGAGQRPAACRSSSSSPARPHPHDEPGKELLQQIAELDARPAVRRQGPVRRGLRHQRRPPPGPGGRRLAQQPAPAAGSQRAPAARRWCSTAASTARSSTAGGPRPTTASTASPSASARRTRRPTIHDARDAERSLQVAERRGHPALLRPRRATACRGWIARMKRAIRTLGWRFNADRMVMDYVQHAYLPAAGGISCDTRR